jgi:hypothetical protein
MEVHPMAETYDITPTGSNELTGADVVVGGLLLLGALVLGGAILNALFRDGSDSRPALPEPDLVKVETYYFRKK